MRRSEIFDSFVKIAQEKGMISNDSSDSKKKLEQTGRADSLDISAIEALYGVKPNSPKDMDYKSNIMEIAHPNSVVVSPSYDKLNGLVESNIERQNILLHIVQKTPDGLSTQRKYAEKELLLSLVRIGNDLDNRNEDELRKLSDFCMLQVKEESSDGFKKEALGPLAIVLIAAACIGAVYAHQHLPNTNQGLDQNYKKLMGELDDFLTSNTDWGVGHEYDQELKADVQGFKERLEKFYSTYQSLNDVIRELEKPKDAKDLIEIAKKPKTQSVLAAVKTLRALINNMAPYLDQIASNFSSEFYKKRHVKDTGVLTSLLEYTHLSGGASSLFADNFQDVVNAIPAFRSSVGELLKLLSNAKSIEDKAAADLASAQAKADTDFGGGGATTDWGSTPSAPPTAPGSSPKSAPKSVADLDKEADELGKMLGGFAT